MRFIHCRWAYCPLCDYWWAVTWWEVHRPGRKYHTMCGCENLEVRKDPEEVLGKG
jgi:hypothetical protein